MNYLIRFVLFKTHPHNFNKNLAVRLNFSKLAITIKKIHEKFFIHRANAPLALVPRATEKDERNLIKLFLRIETCSFLSDKLELGYTTIHRASLVGAKKPPTSSAEFYGAALLQRQP